MAIFHLSVKIISRTAGRSAVAAAAYRSAERLHDERLDRAHDFTNKSGVVHSEVLLPENSPEKWLDRERLWNDVEAFEKRKDAQLAREVEFAIPREMNQAQGIELARDFVQREFVDQGMVADLNVHWDIGADGLAKPHAHVMLTMREIVAGDDGEAGFGAKVREWNRTELVEQWRERWARHVNERLAELDIDARVDHRSLAAQGIELEPQDKIGPAASRMVGTRQLERVLSHAAEVGAKVVLVGDPQQLQSIEAGAAFRAIHEWHGGAEITEVRRQRAEWQREATRELATGRAGEAIRAYDDAGMVHAASTRDTARTELIDRWDRDRQARPGDTRIILTHTNDEVRALNDAARERMHASGDLGDDVAVKVERGDRMFAAGDRIIFLRNERSLEVKNGTLGTIEQVDARSMTVRTGDGRSVAFEFKDYAQVDHGYAATIHKAQGMTVDRAHVLATPGMDSHSAYVALSRHRSVVDVHYGRDDFKDQGKLIRTLSRERAKDMAQDYAKADPARSYAEQRAITFRERIAENLSRAGREIAKQVPEKARSIFAGFKPTVKRASIEPREPSRTVETRRAVEQYARAQADIDRMHAKDLPVLRHQHDALARAGDALGAIDPHARRDLASAFERQPELVAQVAQGNSQPAMRAMSNEADIRIDPAKRADRFVDDWQKLQLQRSRSLSRGEQRAASRFASEMGAMAKSLERDAQVESILRGRKAALGIDAHSVRSVGQDLVAIADLGRSRGIGIGM